MAARSDLVRSIGLIGLILFSLIVIGAGTVTLLKIRALEPLLVQPAAAPVRVDVPKELLLEKPSIPQIQERIWDSKKEGLVIGKTDPFWAETPLLKPKDAAVVTITESDAGAKEQKAVERADRTGDNTAAVTPKATSQLKAFDTKPDSFAIVISPGSSGNAGSLASSSKDGMKVDKEDGASDKKQPVVEQDGKILPNETANQDDSHTAAAKELHIPFSVGDRTKETEDTQSKLSLRDERYIKPGPDENDEPSIVLPKASPEAKEPYLELLEVRRGEGYRMESSLSPSWDEAPSKLWPYTVAAKVRPGGKPADPGGDELARLGEAHGTAGRETAATQSYEPVKPDEAHGAVGVSFPQEPPTGQQVDGTLLGDVRAGRPDTESQTAPVSGDSSEDGTDSTGGPKAARLGPGFSPDMTTLYPFSYPMGRMDGDFSDTHSAQGLGTDLDALKSVPEVREHQASGVRFGEVQRSGESAVRPDDGVSHKTSPEQGPANRGEAVSDQTGSEEAEQHGQVAPSEVTGPPAAWPDIRVLGIAGSSKQWIALVAVDGKVYKVAEGESVGSLMVASITRSEVQLQLQGEKRTFGIWKEGGDK